MSIFTVLNFAVLVYVCVCLCKISYLKYFSIQYQQNCRLASLADSESQRCLALERRMMGEMHGGNESLSATAQHEEMAKEDRYTF